MTKYLVLWRRKIESLPKEPEEIQKVLGLLMGHVAQGMEDGTTLDWGVSLDSVHGYTIREIDGLKLQKELMLTAPYLEVLDILEIKTFEETQQTVKAVMETMAAMK